MQSAAARGGAVGRAVGLAQMAATSMMTQPMEGETITNPKPLIKANLATMGDIDPKSVEMRVERHRAGAGEVRRGHQDGQLPGDADVAGQEITRVILNANVGGKRAETRWDHSSSTLEGDCRAAALKPPAKP